MSKTNISSQDGLRSVGEEYSSYSNINNAPKLRHQTQEGGTSFSQPWVHDPKKNKSSFATIRTFSPSGRRKRSDLFSFLEAEDDLSTRHVDNYREGRGGVFGNAIWSRIPQSQHFVVSDNLKFILNCCMWYISSSVTNNIGKSIMNSFQFPVTLTFVQFGLVAFWCYVVSTVFTSRDIRRPTQDILKTIAPLAVFLIVGHVFSSIAISRVPVSLVHTIKALAPLFTVLFYRMIFQVRYSERVYISLLPLTLGVILACSFTFSNNFVGLACALGSCFVFVTQNIFSKRILFKESKLGDRNPNKLDKLNVLFYSSSISFLLMIPLWIYYDGSSLLSLEQGDMTNSTLIIYLFINGTMNFSQNWFAFTTLSLTSPVTYSILSLLKRIFVIVMSIIWFGQHVSFTQSMGILLTFVGLWMYQKAKSDVDKGETEIRQNSIESLLPIQSNNTEKTSNWIPMKSL